MSKIIRVNVGDQTCKIEPVPEKYELLGGRSLTSQIICDEVPPQCNPLESENKVVFAPGFVTGTSAPSSGRMSVGGKSPLTGGIKEANAGTPVSQKLGRMQIKAIIVEGEPKNPGDSWLLHLTADAAEFVPANDLKGKGTYETVAQVRSRFGDKVSYFGIGPSGEFKMASAGIFFSDMEGRPSRFAARGGLGAVLGSKGIKAVVVDDAGAEGVVIKNPELFKVGRKKVADALTSHDLTKPGGVLNSFGTSAVINVMNEVGALPTRNFSSGRFEGAAKISGDAIVEAINARGGGKQGHGCHPGCLIQCSNIYPREDGSEHVAKIEFESAGLLGANLEIDNLDHVAELVRLCNDLGLDTIEVGATIGVIMEAGYISFGDGPAAIKLLEEVRAGSPMGRIVGSGTAVAGQIYGVKRVPVVKKQALAAYDPRVIKGIGLTYGSSPMGADHTAGYTMASEVFGVGGKTDSFDTDGKVELSRAMQVTTGFLDSTGYCLFIAFAISDIASGFEGVMETVNAVLGTEWTTEDSARLGATVLKIEKEFNRRAGLNKEADRLPSFFAQEPLPPHNTVFDMDDKDIDAVLEG
ncbi:aldehyde ferredoxin oxidoreductase family protein [Dethiobacter alkaliphilus]|uniref:aldehyde ferredoxin oxidoreductase family protein n=1 Tax=Dethiobacter alkaliphilus TaxID=427926 RepID=UPI002227BDFE|nr:aldehyde ferredoxin oxidoreductase C-terminal domain-containing protein [Dethiobacter alkaliphilus]MCW3489500.1 aldehyde ferredoxin oxidoreductase [Dethiobacter alkaliphilus]